MNHASVAEGDIEIANGKHGGKIGNVRVWVWGSGFGFGVRGLEFGVWGSIEVWSFERCFHPLVSLQPRIDRPGRV